MMVTHRSSQREDGHPSSLPCSDPTLATRAALAAAIPLKIDWAEIYADITLLLGGDDWSLSATCDCRWRTGHDLEVTVATLMLQIWFGA